MTDDGKQNQNNEEAQKLSRRKFIRNSSFAAGGVVVGGVAGSVIPWGGTEQHEEEQTQNQATNNTNNRKDYNHALMNFTQWQFKVIEAAVERIYPKDDNGPGAKELGVGYYIDHQLAGDWGFNAREYMEPPFYHGEKEQGYQGRLKRREIFNIAVREMQNYSQKKFEKKFEDLKENQQDQVLKDFEKDNVDLTTISASGFFEMFRSAVLEGVYADPLYGGNMNMQGWKMRNYPGDQMGYRNIIEKDFQKITPSSLQDHMG